MNEIRAAVQDAVAHATETTFADMAFIDVTKADDQNGSIQTGQLMHIDFARPLEGGITLYLSSPLKFLITSNIFGGERDSIGSEQIDDCLLELLNVLAGNFLKSLGVPAGRHALSLPQLYYDDADINDSKNFTTYNFDAEDNPFQVSVHYKEQIHD